MGTRSTSSGSRQRAETRQRILVAAEQLMRRKGFAGATTKEIARTAGLSEGTLYNHFESKEDLFLCVLRDQLPGFIRLIMSLPERVGESTIRENLEAIARAALVFYNQTVPMSASAIGEPDLMNSLREGVLKRGAGPHRANEGVARYLSAEQRLGRVQGSVQVAAVADLLLGACFQKAFLLRFQGLELPAGGEERYAREIVEALIAGLAAD